MINIALKQIEFKKINTKNKSISKKIKIYKKNLKFQFVNKVIITKQNLKKAKYLFICCKMFEAI